MNNLENVKKLELEEHKASLQYFFSKMKKTQLNMEILFIIYNIFVFKAF